MDLGSLFQSLARYNRLANERVYEACAHLDDAEYRKQRSGSFGSIHALLNHILFGDRRWMDLFEHDQRRTPPLQTILYDEFPLLREARAREDTRIERFFGEVGADFWERRLQYTNSKGIDYIDTAQAACSHLFNHQTHHRGQVHVMLSQTGTAPLSLDMHRILNP